MSQILLQQLNDQDLAWLKQNGVRQQIPSGKTIVQQHQQLEDLFIILNGEFAATIAKNSKSVLGSAFAALESDPDLEQEIARLKSGEIIGEMSFLDISPASTTFTTLNNASVLSIPSHKLKQKLAYDLPFAARFYRAISLLLSDRFQRLVNLFLRRRLGQIDPLQDVPMLFGELKDSDVDWMLRQGYLRSASAGETIIEIGRPIEHLFIVLRGKLSLAVSEQKNNQLDNIFAVLEQEATPQALGREIAKLTPGEIVGEVGTFDSTLSAVTLSTLEDSLLLAIPRRSLLVRLQQDPGMAARFYRIASIILSGRLQGLISRLGFGKGSYNVGQTLTSSIEYEDEIDLAVMDNIALGGARFNWMLKRLRVS
ncbi:MAG: cyclic nucleotide-binding domain-containing protein [Cyanobacteria bacterium P01_C01_bin.72]